MCDLQAWALKIRQVACPYLLDDVGRPRQGRRRLRTQYRSTIEVSSNNMSNILRHFMERTHLGTETTPSKETWATRLQDSGLQHTDGVLWQSYWWLGGSAGQGSPQNHARWRAASCSLSSPGSLGGVWQGWRGWLTAPSERQTWPKSSSATCTLPASSPC